MNDFPKFEIEQTTGKVRITSGKYTHTIFKFIDVQTNLVNGINDLSFNVEFDEFWLNSGKVTNAHEYELQVFVESVATHILTETYKAYITLLKADLI